MSLELSESPLRGSRSNLYNHFEAYVVHRENISEKKCHYVTRRILQGGSFIVGVGGRFPFATSSLAFAGSNRGYGIALMVCNIGSFSVFCTQCLLNITSGKMRPLSEAEKAMFVTDKHCITSLKVISKIVLAAAGVISQFPLAYLCYIYNGRNIVYPIIVMIDSGIPIYSLFLSEKAWKEKCKYSAPFDQKLLVARGKLICAIQNFRASLPRIYKANDRLLGSLEQQINNNPLQLLRLILERPISKEQISKIEKFVGLIFSASQLIFYATLSYNGMREFSDIRGSIVGATAITGCNAYLQGDVLIKSVHNQWQTASSFFAGSPRHTLASTCFPKFRRFLSLVDLTLSSLSYGPAAQVAEQMLPDPISEPTKYIGSVGLGFLVTYSLQIAFDELTLWLAQKTRFGDEQMRQLIDLDTRLNVYILTLTDAPVIEFEQFLQDLPADLTNKLLSNNDLDELYRRKTDQTQPKNLSSEEINSIVSESSYLPQNLDNM